MSVENILQFLARSFQARRRRSHQFACSSAAVEALESRSLLTLIGISATVSATVQTPSGGPETPIATDITAVVTDDADRPEFPGFAGTYDIDISSTAIAMNFSGSAPTQVVPAGTFYRYRFEFDLAPNETIASASAVTTSVLVPNVTVNGNTVTAEIGAGMTIGTGFNALINVNIQRSGTVIMGRKFNDANNDGIRTSNEAWLNGWTMELRDLNANGDVVATTLSRDIDLNGNGQIESATESGVYLFENVPGGTYVVQEQLFGGWIQSLPSSAIVAKAYDLDQNRNLTSNGDLHLNWGGLNEKWFFGRRFDLNQPGATGERSWYYIVPDGSVYQWNGSPKTALTGTLVTTLDSTYYDDLTLLLDAPSPRQYIADVDAANPATFRRLNFGNYLVPPEFTQVDMVEDQTANTLTFNWNAETGATYDIWISDIAANQQYQFIPDLDGTDIPLITQLPDRRYRVWIRANSQGVTSAWSDPYEFELFRDPVNIITGGTESNSVDATPTITWQAVSTASSYDVRVLTADGDVAYIATRTSGTSHRIATPLMFGVDYRVDVRANFADGSRTMWNDANGVPLEGIGAALRIDGRPAPTVNGNIVFWNAVPAATSYEVWINRLDDQGQLLQAQVVHATNVRDLRHEFPIIAAGNYAVWVRAIRAEGGEEYQSLWSPRVDFRYVQPQLTDARTSTSLDDQMLLSRLSLDAERPDAVPTATNRADRAPSAVDVPGQTKTHPVTPESEQVVAAVMAELAQSDMLYDSQS
ncbi:MAG: SdrD B-like domain-containing protein [Planctomycetaceae bacterium]